MARRLDFEIIDLVSNALRIDLKLREIATNSGRVFDNNTFYDIFQELYEVSPHRVFINYDRDSEFLIDVRVQEIQAHKENIKFYCIKAFECIKKLFFCTEEEKTFFKYFIFQNRIQEKIDVNESFKNTNTGIPCLQQVKLGKLTLELSKSYDEFDCNSNYGDYVFQDHDDLRSERINWIYLKNVNINNLDLKVRSWRILSSSISCSNRELYNNYREFENLYISFDDKKPIAFESFCFIVLDFLFRFLEHDVKIEQGIYVNKHLILLSCKMTILNWEFIKKESGSSDYIKIHPKRDTMIMLLKEAYVGVDSIEETIVEDVFYGNVHSLLENNVMKYFKGEITKKQMIAEFNGINNLCIDNYHRSISDDCLFYLYQAGRMCTWE
jgi:hypothetical protein